MIIYDTHESDVWLLPYQICRKKRKKEKISWMISQESPNNMIAKACIVSYVTAHQQKTIILFIKNYH